MDLARPKRTNAPMKPKEIKGEKMAGKNVTVNINEVVEDKLKLAAEAFAIKVFENPDLFVGDAYVFEAAVEIYKCSIDNNSLTPIQNFN
ncbi:hypothetical protein GRR92_06240 [Lactococcus lactis subsp. lactis]|uniref:hypothetical protein n=1 Tax=Lactococcus lactis TaxID=1358 RepID=UPI001BA9BE30|nr:hypothetical protein [Lactococcus lactis]MBR8674069.1 hypothetical protein [Lactococcus lactis subsp. lactis]MBR8676972.1 hypothetical protein [Lactococcus lactis subsp. lactis]MBR8684241.1 hypothetical protein [Lactococcus lactis subsp. lactis]